MTEPSHPTPAARRPATGRLAVRLSLGLGFAAAAILLGAGWWYLGELRHDQTDLVQLSADRAADIVLRSTRDAMLRNDPGGVLRVLDAIGAQPGIERIRIFDKQGRIQVSTARDETGRTVDKAAEQCTVCHRAGAPLERPATTDRMRVYHKADGTRVLAVVLPIPNAPDCSTAECHAHDPSLRVLGVLDAQLSLSAVDARIAQSQRSIAVGIVAAVVVTLLLVGWIVWWTVLRPLTRLERAVALLRSGDLSARAEVTTTDEIGALTASWNDTVAELGKARSELETWNQTLEARVAETTKALENAHRNMVFVEKMASLGKLASVVAHEINNPLAGIATYARLIRTRLSKTAGGAPLTPAQEETAKSLELVETEAVRCGNIVRNLLLFSRTQGSRLQEDDLRPILDRCVMLVRHQAELQGVSISVDAPPALPRVVCDSNQVQQAVLALATNAIEAMPDGGSLVVGAAPEAGGGVRLWVADTGCGIEEKDLPHVFEPFFTTKEQGKGVGLGLAVVYGIATRHGGRVEVDSTPGRGSTFTLRLPARPPPPDPNTQGDLA